jgi:hypothetical protein
MARRPPVASIANFTAPVGGWNSYDSIAGMPPGDAVRLDNVFPETTYCRLRRGSTLFGQIGGVGSTAVSSLMTWASGTTDKLLAAIDGTLVDMSAGGAGVSIGAGYLSDIWQYTNFSTPGGQFLVMVNGTAKQWTYNGSAVTAAANTLGPGVPDNNAFAMVVAYQQRLFFAAPNSLYLYYLPVNVLQGELHAIDLGAFMPHGGAIADLGTWTRDNGFGGMDDLLVIVSTHGEVVIYQGIDPDTADAWTMTGRFQIGQPVGGHRALCRLGPDMMLICEDGFQAMARYLAVGQSQALTTAISRKIGNAVTQAVKANKAGFGWDAILYAADNMLIVNVPQAGGGFQQYAVNTITGAWCRFIGMQAWCWTMFQGNLFFGSDTGKVVQADFGTTDQGVPIAYDLVTSFQVLGQNPQQKRATMCRPFIMSTGQANPVMDVNVDFNVTPVTSPVTSTASATLWDAFNWDQADWAANDIVQSNWYSVDGIGTSFAVHMSGEAVTASFRIMAFDIAYEAGVGFI